MTRNTGLYEDREEDASGYESQDGSLSPTNGYFNDRAHPQHVYVQEPTTTITHAKELEAAEESHSLEGPSSSRNGESDRSTVYTPTSPTTYTASSLTRSTPGESTPLLHGSSHYDAPPPAYSANEPVYRTYEAPHSRMSVGEETIRGARRGPFSTFLTSVESENMGGQPVQSDTERNVYRRPRKSRRFGCCSSLCNCCYVLLSVAFLILLFPFYMMSNLIRHDPGHDLEHQPVPDVPEVPGMPKWPSECVRGDSTDVSFDFDKLSSFSFSEAIEFQRLYSGIYGRITITAAPDSQSSPVHVNISASPSEPYSIKSLHVQKTVDRISMMTPELRRGNSDSGAAWQKPCVIISANIFVKPDVAFEKLDISTTSLEIVLTHSFKATVDRTTLQATTAGVFSESSFESRETIIKTTTSSVSGNYDLLDLLSIESQSGSIGVDVTPKNASKEPNPANLRCTSRSGSISVHMPPSDFALEEIPKRDYHTLIKTNVGSISGNYIHGSRTEMTSHTGSISVAVLPYSADDYESTFVTSTSSSMTSIDLKSPHTGKTIKRMTSSHTSQAGSVQLHYPQEWEGKIRGSTTTGSLTLKGKDVVVSEYDDGWVSKTVSAHKGKGDLEGKLTFQTLTGSADVTVGDVVGGGTLLRELDSEMAEGIWSDEPVFREE